MELFLCASVCMYRSEQLMMGYGKAGKAMKDKRLFILIGAVLLAIAVFWLLDFRLAFSNTGMEKLVMTVDMGESNMPVSMQQKDKISLVLTGEGPLVQVLQKELTKELDAAGLGEVLLEQELLPGYPNPVLVVK